MILSIPVFGQNRVNPHFAQFFELTPDETNRLSAAVAQAAQRMEDLADLHAVGNLDAAAGKLTVNVTAFPAEGGIVYNELLGQFQTVLGPERFAYFNIFFGDTFDQSFDGFGLNQVRYEVDLTPTVTPQGQTNYSYTRSFVTGDAKGRGQGGGQLPLPLLIKYNPTLKRFIPPSLVEAQK